MVVTPLMRYGAALVLSLGMFGLAFWLAFDQCRDNWLIRAPQVRTLQELKSIRVALEEFHEARGAYPDRLTELPEGTVFARHFDNDDVLDTWGYPVVYEPARESFRLVSYGRDGKPGGEGLDADLDGTEERDSPQLTPSLRQFVRECPEPMWFSCIATGVLTFVLCVGNTRSRERPLTMLRFVGNTVAALLVCLFLGQILVLLHVPNGH